MWKECLGIKKKKGKVLSVTDWLAPEKDLIKFNEILKLIQKLSWIDQASYHLKDTTSFLSVQNWSKGSWQERGKVTDRKESNQLSARMKPSISWPSLWLFRYFLSSVLKSSTRMPFSLVSYEGRQHGSVSTKKTKLPIIRGVSTVLGHQQSCILLI